MMAWALHSFKLSGINPISHLAHSSSISVLSRSCSKMVLPQSGWTVPVKYVRTPPKKFGKNFFSSGTWASTGNQSKSNLNKGLSMLPTPAMAGFSTYIGTLQEHEPNNPTATQPTPCQVTVGAAWAPKNPRRNLPTWCLADCGEDAFFATLVNSNYCLGVADGVGGWSECGVDPSQFAWELMNNCKSQCEAQGIIGNLDPKEVLTHGYNRLIKERKVRAGSSTACIAVVNTDTGLLTSVNLGDSGYVIIRKGSVVYRSSETTHYFNAPYQLSVIPPELNSGNHIVNNPSEGEVANFQLKHGDVVVMGTDGLFDNLFNQDIESEVVNNRPKNLNDLLASPTKSADKLTSYSNSVAGALVKKARIRAKDTKRPSPFSTEAAKHGYRFSGGKMDDITVVIGLISMKKTSEPQL